MNISIKMRHLPVFLFAFLCAPNAYAATTPSLGAAASFGILGYTYTNTSTFTNITGDLGYTVAPNVIPTVNGSVHANDATYTQAVNDQGAALAALNSQSCTFTFAPGSVDLATDSSHGSVGVFTPGVYCINGSMTVGGGATITMVGAGTYIFRPTGALTTSDDSLILGSGGASTCNVFWTPGGSTTIGTSAYFYGTDIEPLGPVAYDILVGAHSNWFGRALDGNIGALATVTTNVDVYFTSPTCGVPPPSTGTLHVIKTFYNDYGGTAVPSDAMVHVKNGAGDVSGSPHAGAATPGTLYTLNADTYTVSEDAIAGYTAIFSGDCDATGHVTLGANQNKTCTISNDQNPPPAVPPAMLRVIKHVVNTNGGSASASSFVLHVMGSGSMGMSDVSGSPASGAEAPGTSYTLVPGSYVVSENATSSYSSVLSGDCDATGHVTLASGDSKTCTITNTDVPSSVIPPATLHVIKHVINNNGGTASASSFTLYVKGSGSMGVSDVVGSPASGIEAPGRLYTLVAGTYTVSENAASGYTQSMSGDCASNGTILLNTNDSKTCTITNDDILSTTSTITAATTTIITTGGGGEKPPATLHVVKVVVNDHGGKAIVSDAVIHVTNGMGDVAGSPHAGVGAPGASFTLAAGTYNVSENFFPGYTVKVSGDCAVNGDVTLASGDSKTCTIMNNDVTTVVPPPITIVTHTATAVPVNCDVCSKLTYDLYIINPDHSERHTGTDWVYVTDRGHGIKRYSFEDATLDPRNPLFDHNDSVIDVDYTNCQSVKFMFVSSDASWKHQVRIKVSIDGVTQSDTLVTDDSKAVVGTIKSINATSGVNMKLACASGSTANFGLKGKILLQVQQHGEAWYIHPVTGLRYYMKDGPTAYGMMRNFGLGITDKNLTSIPGVQSVAELKSSSSACGSNAAASKLRGQILLQVQQHGEAWYVDASKCRRIYLKDGAAAYALMRFLGVGITDADLAKLKIGQ